MMIGAQLRRLLQSLGKDPERRPARQAGAEPIPDYREWLRLYDTVDEPRRAMLREEGAAFAYRPLVSIVMPVVNASEKWLRPAIDSVLDQIYPGWELCIADDHSSSPSVRAVLEEYARRDARIKPASRATSGGIAIVSNAALARATGEFIALLGHDDTLAEHALHMLVRTLNRHPDTDIVYSDEDAIDEQGNRQAPYFKPDWNPDLFLSQNIVCRLAVFRASLVDEIGGFRAGFEGSEDYDLALRATERTPPGRIRHIPRSLYHRRLVPRGPAADHGEARHAVRAAVKAVEEHLQRRRVAARVSESPLVPGALRVRYAVPDPPPLATLIIPTRNACELTRRCIESIFEKTAYTNYEILVVDNGSDDRRLLDYLEAGQNEGKLRVLRDPRPFNYAALNNEAVRHARGEIIGLLNNDLEVIAPDWLTEMVGHACRPEVGAVGALLWYPDDTLQHGGVVLGLTGVAGHAYRRLARKDIGHFSRAALTQNFSAVTAACALLRKELFLGVGGLDEDNLGVAYNDVDLCLKLGDLGYRIVCTPFAELYHHESATRGYEDTPERQARFEREIACMVERWGQRLLADPCYSPNLTLASEDCSLAWPPRLTWEE